MMGFVSGSSAMGDWRVGLPMSMGMFLMSAMASTYGGVWNGSGSDPHWFSSSLEAIGAGMRYMAYNTPTASGKGGIVGKSEQSMKMIANDLNRVYKKKYGIDNAFSVQERVRKIKVRTNEWALFSPSTWKNAFRKAEYKQVDVTDYKLVGSSDFNWSRDRYTAAMSELMSMDYDVELRIVADDSRKADGVKSIYMDRGGGYTANSGLVYLSDRLGNSSWDYPESSRWSLGNVVLHELLFHIHPMGLNESSKDVRQFYEFRWGKGDHPAGPNQTPGIQKLP